MSNSRLYLILSTILIGVVCLFSRMHEFSWGKVVILSNGATFNDLWYFNLSAFSDAFFIAAVAMIGDYIANDNKRSYLAFVLKYSSILLAMLFSTRAIFHIFTYASISIFEIVFYSLILVYTAYRALLWYKKYLKNHATNTSRYLMEDH